MKKTWEHRGSDLVKAPLKEVAAARLTFKSADVCGKGRPVLFTNGHGLCCKEANKRNKAKSIRYEASRLLQGISRFFLLCYNPKGIGDPYLPELPDWLRATTRLPASPLLHVIHSGTLMEVWGGLGGGHESLKAVSLRLKVWLVACLASDGRICDAPVSQEVEFT